MVVDRNLNVEYDVEQLKDAFMNCGWEEVVEGVHNRNYDSISRALSHASTNAETEGREPQGKVLRLLSDACSMVLVPDNRNEPFRPLWVGNGRCSPVLDDFTESEIGFFAEIVNEIDNSILKGRLADLVWCKGKPRDVKFALTAIDSYTQLSLDMDTWIKDGHQCWERAIRLSRMIRLAGEDQLNQIEISIINALESATAENNIPVLSLVDLLRSNKLGKHSSTIVARKFESLAKDFKADARFYVSEAFYNEAAKWFRDSGDDNKYVEMTVSRAETFVSDANTRVSSENPDYGVAASFLENAIQIYRDIPHIHRNVHRVNERIQELTLSLNEYGKRALENMATVSSDPIDLTECIQQARNTVSGKSMHEALGAFTNLHETNFSKLRNSAIDSLERSPFLASIPKVVSSHDGRIIAKTPGVVGATPSEHNEKEIHTEMNRFHYGTLIGVVVQALILPALEVLNLEHRLTTSDLVSLARRSSIVPINREFLFGKALAHGFNMDFVTSIHLLAPQIEHMVRFHLKVAGVVTTHLDKDGIEFEKSLSTLMDIPETRKIFGEDLEYEIKALFCDQIGPNLRNNIAHGLLNDQEVILPM